MIRGFARAAALERTAGLGPRAAGGPVMLGLASVDLGNHNVGVPDAPADDRSDQPVPFVTETPAQPTPGQVAPILPGPAGAWPAYPPAAYPPAGLPPAGPPPAVAEPLTIATPTAVAEPPTIATPTAVIEPPAVVGPAAVPGAAAMAGPPMAAPAASPWQVPAPWPPAAYGGQQAGGYPLGWTGAAPPPSPGFVYPGLGAPAPKRSRAAVIVSIVAAVVVLACLGFGTATFFAFRHLDAAPVVNAPVPTDYPTDHLPTDDPLPDPEPTHGGDVKRYVIDRPATAQTWPKVKAEQALDLTSAAANFGSPAEGKLVLQRYGFKDGYTRRWIDEDGSYITVRVLRFTDAGGGDNFTNFYIDANQAGDWGEPEDVPGVPDAAGFVKPKKEKNGFQRSLAVGDAGDVVAIVLADQLPPARSATPDALLSDEFDLL
jgi:hypothetical protein